MSKMTLRGHRGVEFKLNVTQFRSTMSAAITSAQTRTMAQHFPVRAGQPDIQFTVQFRSIDDKHKFQNFVRDHQRYSLTADHSKAGRDQAGMVTLTWPQRGIDGWQGYITSLSVREARFEYAPRITFGVLLIGSMLSIRTYVNSRGGNNYSDIIANQLPDFGTPDDLIPAPVRPHSQQQPTDRQPDNAQQQDQAQQNQTQQDQVQNSAPPETSFFDWAGGIYP